MTLLASLATFSMFATWFGAETIMSSLVEQASAFGSAGALVTITFGLFTSLGSAKTAIATLVAGMLAYLGALAAELRLSFLTSLAVALATYGIGAAIGTIRERGIRSLVGRVRIRESRETQKAAARSQRTATATSTALDADHAD